MSDKPPSLPPPSLPPPSLPPPSLPPPSLPPPSLPPPSPPDSNEMDFSAITQALEEIDELSGTMVLSPGDYIGGGRFIVQEHIGQGAVGEVWRVLDTLFNLDLAVKVVRIQDRVSVAERDELTTRVMREASSAREAGSRCPHIVRIFDIASLPSGDPFIVMEFLDGATLRQWLSACAPADWQVVQTIGIQCATALRALHRKGFIHRDIKPNNIFALDDEESPDVPYIKLIDFGLAKDLEAGKLTRTAASLGTLRYMAPEQLLEHTATRRSDIFSLGVILFEALTGRNPLPVNHSELAALYRTGLSPLCEFAPQTPLWLSTIVDHCLQLDESNRPTADALIAALQSGPDVQEPAKSLDSEVLRQTSQPPPLPPLPHSSLPPLPAAAPLAQPTPVAAQSPFAALPALPLAEPTPEPQSDRTESGLPMAFSDERPTRAYSSPSTSAQPQRSFVPLAIAFFAGALVIAAALVYSPKPSPDPLPPKVAAASEPALSFKPRGPVNVDDFPQAKPPAAPVSTAPVTQAPVATPSSTAAPVSAKSKPKPKTRPKARTRSSKRTTRKPRKGLTKTFAEVRDSALARSGQPLAPNPTAPAYDGPVEYVDDDDNTGAQFYIGKRKAPTASATLPESTALSAKLVTGISSAAHGVVLARLTKDVTIDGKTVLKAGDILKGRSRNNFERVFITFTSGKRGSSPIKFIGNAVTGGQPGLAATKKIIPKDERGTNVVARGALTTAGGVAARLGGGVAGELASDVAREGVTEIRPDFREREPFILTVPKDTRFTVIVTGK